MLCLHKKLFSGNINFTVKTMSIRWTENLEIGKLLKQIINQMENYFSVMEIVGPDKRLLAGLGCQVGLTVGYIASAILAYYVTNWRILQVLFVLPGFAFLTYWW